MLITDDSKGTSDGKERDQLQAMVAVGSEFITYQDDTSRVQKSGEFVRIEKEDEEEISCLLVVHETPDAWVDHGATIDALSDEEYFSTPANQLQRTRMFVSTKDRLGIETGSRALPRPKVESRVPRYTNFISGTLEAHAHTRVHEADYATQAGKRRVFSLGDGKVLLVRELTKPGDDRWYMGVGGAAGYSRRRKRTARVELTEINPETGAVGKVLMGFDIHSGLGFDPYEGADPSSLNGGLPYRSYSTGTALPGLPPYATNVIYMAVVGAMWGRLAISGTAGDAGIQGDASDTYAVAEPAYVNNGGKPAMVLVAVYPSSDDVHNPQYAAPYQLTCARTTPGGVVKTKISFPAITGTTSHYYGATGMELVRTSPTNIVLVAHVHAVQSSYPGTIPASARSRLFFWSGDNGATWTYAQVSTTAPVFPTFPYSSHIVKDADTLLVFSTYQSYASVAAPDRAGVEVHAVTRAGTSYVMTVPASLFNQVLVNPYTISGKLEYNAPYIGFGYGGALTVQKKGEKKKKRLWLQFDPRWEDYTAARVLSSPPGRPQLLVSDDGGATWARRFLPSVWQHRVGFVVATDEKTLIVPVSAPRSMDERGVLLPLKVSIYKSKDGGETWKATRATFTLPAFAWTDGKFLPGIGDGAVLPGPTEYDIDESTEDYNRGELFPIVAFKTPDGPAPVNPSRPWVADYRFKEPTYG